MIQLCARKYLTYGKYLRMVVAIKIQYFIITNRVRQQDHTLYLATGVVP